MISKRVIEDVIAHARDEAPNECCGLLVGAGDVVDEAVRCTNRNPSPARYTLDPRDHIATNKRLRDSGRSVVGAYHSHPHSPAVPSETDLAEAHYPDFIWMIVSLRDPHAPDIRAYRIEGDVFTPLEPWNLKTLEP